MRNETIVIDGIELKPLTLKQIRSVTDFVADKIDQKKGLKNFEVLEAACFDHEVAEKVINSSADDAAEKVFAAADDAEHFTHIAHVLARLVPQMDAKQRYAYYRQQKPLHEVLGKGDEGVDEAHPTNSPESSSKQMN